MRQFIQLLIIKGRARPQSDEVCILLEYVVLEAGNVDYEGF